jgi:hypothetical protein
MLREPARGAVWRARMVAGFSAGVARGRRVGWCELGVCYIDHNRRAQHADPSLDRPKPIRTWRVNRARRRNVLPVRANPGLARIVVTE